MGIEKSYARATISSNLMADEYHHDHEKLAAVALSGMAEGSWPHSNMLLRVKYANDATSYPALAEEWREHVKVKAALRGWPIEVSASKVARLALDHWLTDVCPICAGRGHLPVDGIPNLLSDDPCPACNGTAKRDICVKPAMLIKYVTDMVELLEMLTIRAGGEALRKLAHEASDL